MSRFNDAVMEYESSKSEVLFESYFNEVCYENGVPQLQFMVVEESSIIETISNFFKSCWEYIKKGFNFIVKSFSDLIKKFRKDKSVSDPVKDILDETGPDFKQMKEERARLEKTKEELKSKAQNTNRQEELRQALKNIEEINKKIDKINNDIDTIHKKRVERGKFKPGAPVDFSKEVDRSVCFTYLPTSKISGVSVDVKELIFTDIGNVKTFLKSLMLVSNTEGLDSFIGYSKDIESMLETKFNENKSSEEYSDKLSYSAVINNEPAYNTEIAKTPIESDAEIVNYTDIRFNDELLKLIYDINKYIEQTVSDGDRLYKERSKMSKEGNDTVKYIVRVLNHEGKFLNTYFAASQKELLKAKSQLDVLHTQAEKIRKKWGLTR